MTPSRTNKKRGKSAEELLPPPSPKRKWKAEVKAESAFEMSRDQVMAFVAAALIDASRDGQVVFTVLNVEEEK